MSADGDILEYALPGGWEVLAGRTDAANDRLRVPGDATPDRATQELAASIAAFHSKARGAGTVAVSCTEARHVSKPKGAPRGTVTIRKESALKVRPLTEAAAAALRVKPLSSGHRADDE
jgi:predicted ribosome quality control (RQC) complex YloA/Tae2 family protein